MSVQAVTTKIISTLGNKESLIPIMIKDGVDSAALTYKSFKEGGKVEGIDRAIDEFGTQAIWIGGIPFYKKLIDWTAYKIAKINPDVDPRIIANKEYSQWALENAQGIMSNSKTQSVKSAISDCLKDGGTKAKNLYKGKIIAATALTLGTFFLLTKTKQKNTKKTVIKDMNQKVLKTNIAFQGTTPKVFAEFDKYTKKEENKPSFKGKLSLKSLSDEFKSLSNAIMFNPVHNMKIIDAGITTERLACSRNKTEFAEHAIKEGSFLFFLYKFGGIIEEQISKLASKKFKMPIDLEIDVLMDNNLEKALKNGKIASDIAKAPLTSQLTDKLDFIINNPDNILVQAAKKSKIVSTVKDAAGNSVVDTSKYIDMDAFSKLAKDLTNIDDKFKISGSDVKNYLKKTQWLKVCSVVANIGISCLFLGYLIPKAVYKYRELKTGSTKFHVAEDIKNNNKKDLV